MDKSNKSNEDKQITVIVFIVALFCITALVNFIIFNLIK